MTALNETEYMIRAFSEGAVDYIIKPVKQEELLARVTTHLRIRDLTQNLQTHVEKLQKANQAFESANGELKDFAYIVSHDLKAPLRGINRLAYWFVTDYAEVINDQGKKMLELLIDRVKRMDNLIDGILKYSRIGRIIGKGEPISLYTLVHDVIDMLTPPETVQIIFSNELPEVVGDRIRMTQVFQNLLSNALKFMDKPEGKISIGCRDKGDHWTFTITDNGPGIEKKHHERIFQIFQTAQPRDIYESTGIGLSIVKKIIELYGGKIWVESVVGEGSTFFFTIPKNKADS